MAVPLVCEYASSRRRSSASSCSFFRFSSTRLLIQSSLSRIMSSVTPISRSSANRLWNAGSSLSIEKGLLLATLLTSGGVGCFAGETVLLLLGDLDEPMRCGRCKPPPPDGAWPPPRSPALSRVFWTFLKK